MLTNARWTRPSSRVVGCGVLAAVCVSLVYLGQVQDPYWTAGRTSQIEPDLLGGEDQGSAESWLAGLEVPPVKSEEADETPAPIETEPDPWELVPTVDFSTAPEREYKEETEARLKSLAECIDSGRCSKNRQSVAILASLPCYMTVYKDYMGGEGIWCRAMIKSLERQGYTVLYARDDWSYVDEVYRRIPDQVKVVIGDDMVRADKIFKTPEDPAGLPAWKTIVMWFFPVVGRSPVGNPWHISAEPGPEHWNATFIGYDMTCPGTPIPTSERNNQVYILAKRLKYFYDISPAWNVTFFPRAALELSEEFPGFEFVAGYKDEDESTKASLPGGMAYPEGVRNLGRLSPEEFARHVKESKTLLGIGSPPQSPSPYHALCQGVPFINPVVLSNEDGDAMDPANWKSAQHSTVARLPEPYNYAAVAWDYESFVRAIRSALTHSTPRYRFDHMAPESLDARMDELMNRDWFGMAQEVKRLRDLGEDKSFSKDKSLESKFPQPDRSNIPRMATNVRRKNLAILGGICVGFIAGIMLHDSGKMLAGIPPSSSQPNHPTCPSQCLDDPYAKPGMVLWGKDQFGKETRYVPFPSIFSSSSQPEKVPLRTKDLDVGGTAYWSNTTEALELAVPAYTQAIKNKEEETVSFARNKVALFIDDRANVETFCLAVGGKSQSWGSHIAAVCHVDWLNLTLASWFLVGMVDDETADWFVSTEKRPITFERRIPEIMLPCMQEAGLENMKPDLVVFSSLFWDESFIWRHGMQVGHYSTDPTDGLHGFFYEELKWHRSRVHELIIYLRSMFGEDVPLMFRTRQHRAKNRWGGVLKIFQLDQSLKSLARETGVRYFSWGSKLEGWLNFQDEDQHYSFGPTTYLFGDMFLFYLHQASVPGCWACQLHLDTGSET